MPRFSRFYGDGQIVPGMVLCSSRMEKTDIPFDSQKTRVYTPRSFLSVIMMNIAFITCFAGVLGMCAGASLAEGKPWSGEKVPLAEDGAVVLDDNEYLLNLADYENWSREAVCWCGMQPERTGSGKTPARSILKTAMENGERRHGAGIRKCRKNGTGASGSGQSRFPAESGR